MTSLNEKISPSGHTPLENKKNAHENLSAEASAGKKLANATSDLLRSAARQMGLAPEGGNQQAPPSKTPNASDMTPAELRRALWAPPRPQSPVLVMKELVREAADNLQLSADSKDAAHKEPESATDTQPSPPNSVPSRNQPTTSSTPMPPPSNPTIPYSTADDSIQRHQYVTPLIRPLQKDASSPVESHAPSCPPASQIRFTPPAGSASSDSSTSPQDTNTNQTPAVDQRADAIPPPSPEVAESRVAAANVPVPPIVTALPLLKPGDDDIDHDLHSPPRKRPQPAFALCSISFCLLIVFVLFDCMLPPGGKSSSWLLLKVLPFAIGIMSALFAMFLRPRPCRLYAAILLFLFVFHSANRKPVLWFMQRVGLIKCHSSHYIVTQEPQPNQAAEKSQQADRF